MPAEAASYEHDSSVGNGYSGVHQVGEYVDRNVVDIFSIHSRNETGTSLDPK